MSASLFHSVACLEAQALVGEMHPPHLTSAAADTVDAAKSLGFRDKARHATIELVQLDPIQIAAGIRLYEGVSLKV